MWYLGKKLLNNIFKNFNKYTLNSNTCKWAATSNGIADRDSPLINLHTAAEKERLLETYNLVQQFNLLKHAHAQT